MTELLVAPRDPIVARDGRPFGAQQGNRMRSMGWLTPQAFAGSLRTWIGKQAGGFSEAVIAELLNTQVRGPLPCKGKILYFPAPADLAYKSDFSEVYKSRPRTPEGVIETSTGLSQLCFLTPESPEEFKPAKPPAFVSEEWMARWLLDRDKPSAPQEQDCLPELKVEERTQVAIDPETYASEESKLFTTAALAFPEGVGLSAQVETSLEVPPDSLHPLGGERRLAYWGRGEGMAGWACPNEIATKLKTHVRLVLATPGLFNQGWLPGWLKKGEPVPGTDVQLELIAAICPRWQPISGWNLKAGPEFGPKPVRRLAPAGAVYFCKVTNGNAADLAARWLHSVADAEQDRNDGFALALWGTWKENYA